MSSSTAFIVDFALKGGGSPFCQGSFIRSYVILTAAQCLLKHDLKDVRLSFNNGTSTHDVGPGDISMVHEAYRPAPFRHDIGLLFLAKNLTSGTIETVQGARGAPGLTTSEGWGLLQYGVDHHLVAMPRADRRVRRGVIRIMDELRCIRDRQTATRTCIGHPGGPLLCRSPSGPPRLCGINMFKYGSTSGPVEPAAYTEVLFYSDWVVGKVRCAPPGTSRDLRATCTPPRGFGPSIWSNGTIPTIRPSSSRSIVRHTFNINYIRGSPDGVEVDHILGINGRFPGPTIHALPGDIVEVTVRNRIRDGQGTSIHWHGIPQAGTPFEDGPASVSQCPIPSGQEYTYRFPIRHAGTFWYHSHVGSQYTEGLWGLLIVHSLRDLHPSDTEFYITLKEWYHNSGHENEEWHLSNRSSGVPPFPNSGLMNGVGRVRCYATNKRCDPRNQTYPVFTLKRGEMNKMVVSNVGGYSTYDFRVEGHKLKVIEIDGMDMSTPKTSVAEFLGAGQRFSAILIPNDNSTGWAGSEYLITGTLRTDLMYNPNPTRNINPRQGDTIKEIVGRIRYVEITVPLTSPLRELRTVSEKRFTEVVATFERFSPLCPPGEECYQSEPEPIPYPSLSYNWNALQDVPPPDRFDVEFTLFLNFTDGTDGVRRATFNANPFIIPPNMGKPLLTRMLENSTFPPTNHFLEVQYGQVVEIVLNNVRRGPHPVHLHGHHFWVVHMGRAGEGVYNLTNTTQGFHPNTRRDTVMVEEESFAVIRFVADNPGVWPMHCHIDWHHLSGMMIVIKEGASVARKLFTVPPAHVELCRGSSITTTTPTTITTRNPWFTYTGSLNTPRWSTPWGGTTRRTWSTRSTAGFSTFQPLRLTTNPTGNYRVIDDTAYFASTRRPPRARNGETEFLNGTSDSSW